MPSHARETHTTRAPERTTSPPKSVKVSLVGPLQVGQLSNVGGVTGVFNVLISAYVRCNL